MNNIIIAAQDWLSAIRIQDECIADLDRADDAKDKDWQRIAFLALERIEEDLADLRFALRNAYGEFACLGGRYDTLPEDVRNALGSMFSDLQMGEDAEEENASWERLEQRDR